MNIVIVGNSAAGLSALQTFRKYDKESSVTIISKEGKLAYSRVLLPYVLREKLPYSVLTIRDEQFYADHHTAYIEGDVRKIDTQTQQVLLENGDAVRYDKLLIATGSRAVMPPIEGIQSERIYNMWTKNDVDALIPCFGSYKKVAVIGSGFVALQAAWAARFRGLEVTVIELMDRIMPSVLDKQGAEILTEQIEKCDVSLQVSTQTQRIERLDDGSFKIHLKDKEPVLADFIIVGTGVRPNIELAADTDIQTARGILVDAYMQTTVPNVYAAGDVAAGPTTFGEENVIHALWPTAVEMGAVAGANMAGKKRPYEGSLNMNVTQMYDVTVASMGRFNDAEIDDAYYFDADEGKGYLKVCYKDGLIIGACLVGSSDAVALFGKLRPIIRKGIKADCDPAKLEHYLNIKTFSKHI